MRSHRASSLALLGLHLLACNAIETDREFNLGLKYYEDGEFAAAAKSFERAAGHTKKASIEYNLALAHLALLREDAAEGAAGRPLPAAHVAPALARVGAVRRLRDLPGEMLVRIAFIEGSMHSLAGNQPAARSAYMQSLELDPGFLPSLRALAELDSSGDPLARFVLAAIPVAKLVPEEKLDSR
jgi:tetratricopeptide (TPR) repeat protein